MSQHQNTTPVSHAPGRHYPVRGHRLWVEAEGDGEPLVLLAGLGPAGSHVIFHPFFTGLAGTHQVIYVDLHGRGRSDRPANLAGITFTDDVTDVAEPSSRSSGSSPAMRHRVCDAGHGNVCRRGLLFLTGTQDARRAS
jgi:hypothetical protein